MPAAERSVLHVLPHPGGGGETYVDLLASMPGYRFDRFHLASSPAAPLRELVRSVAEVMRRARGFDLVHVHGEVAAALCLPTLAARPSVVTLHGLHLVRRMRGARRRAAVLNLRATLRAADRTICVSESEYDELVRAVGAAAERRTVVIRNGVRPPQALDSADRAALRESLELPSDGIVAIWVGSLDERKNPLAAARAAEKAGVTLVIVGEGPLRGELERASSHVVRVVGQREDVSLLLAASDVFVLTSRREGLAFSLLEAMAHGLVPVVTDIPENREAVGDAGVAVAFDDEALSSALRRLAGHSGERAQLAERARRRIGSLFTAAEMARRTQALYDDVLTGARRASSRSSAR